MLAMLVVLAGLAAATPAVPIHQENNGRPPIVQQAEPAHSISQNSITSPLYVKAACDHGCGYSDDNRGWWQKLLTDPVASFTAFLFISTALLWIVTERTLRHARKDYVATHRPHLRIRRIDHLVMGVGQTITAQIEAANIGPTEAKIVQVGVDIFLRPHANPKAALFGAVPSDIPPIVIPAGKVAALSIRSSSALTAADVLAFQAGTHELCALGIINYEDRNGAGRSTSFFRIYKTNGERFFPAPNDPWQGDREFED